MGKIASINVEMIQMYPPVQKMGAGAQAQEIIQCFAYVQFTNNN
jgi:hypothetical protein